MSYAGEPKAPKPDPSTAPQEPTGAVASDSLAAESNRAGGGFSENENVAQLGVKGASSTLANTDTSGATVLHAASSGAERERQDAKGLGSDERGSTGVKYPDTGAVDSEGFGGRHTTEGYTGGPSGDGLSTSRASGGADAVTSAYSGASGDSFADGGAGLGSEDSGYDPSKVSSGSSIPKTGAGSSSTSGGASSGGSSSGPATGAAARPYVESAPNYAATVSGAIRSEGELQPKGKNLVEGDIPETKTFTGNVGGDKDPGRAAVQGFENINANTSGGLNYSGDDKQGNQYDVLESERA